MSRLEACRATAHRYNELIRSGVSIGDAFAECWPREDTDPEQSTRSAGTIHDVSSPGGNDSTAGVERTGVDDTGHEAQRSDENARHTN